MLIIKEVVIGKEHILELIKHIGRKINPEVGGVVYIPEAGKRFGQDLARFIEVPVFDAQKVNLNKLPKNFVLVDCLCDTGKTLQYWAKKLKPVQTVVLVSRTRLNKVMEADIYGFVYTKDYFLVGYGLDYNQKFRNLDSIFGGILTEGESFYSRKNKENKK